MLNSSISLSNTFPNPNEENNTQLSELNDDINPYSYYDNLQSPLIHYYDVENYVDFLTTHGFELVQQPLQATNSSVVTDDSSILEVNNKKMDLISKVAIRASGLKRKRVNNRDRHSKIRTAHGLRDRRMRLSLEVASQFFKLQDMLGYDKASSTLEWLLTQSKMAIEELLVSANNGSPSDGVITKCTTISSISDSEGESIVVEQRSVRHMYEPEPRTSAAKRCVGKENKTKERRLRTTKEAMKIARDKARKRTLEKLQYRFNNNIKDDAKLCVNKSLEACQIMRGYNDFSKLMNYLSSDCVGVGEGFVDGSLLKANWRSL